MSGMVQGCVARRRKEEGGRAVGAYAAVMPNTQIQRRFKGIGVWQNNKNSQKGVTERLSDRLTREGLST